MLPFAMPAASPRTPIVAIVGRPNVGKSTLFNRYAGQRRALVANSPGLTRDRIVQEIEVGGRRILLVDTAGLDPRPERGLAEAVQRQASCAVDGADAILFVVDGKSGLLPEDEVIARSLRRTRKPLLLAVNKVDRPDRHADRLIDFHRLGFEHMAAVSAEHGGGAFDALESLVALLSPVSVEIEQAADDGDPAVRVALVGRPNVGKSTLCNRLLGEERVVVSATAGTTRDAIDTHCEHDGVPYVLIDTAGMRRPGRRSGTGERVGALMSVRSLERAQVALLLLDAEEGVTDQDAHIGRLIRDMGCAAVVVLNKWDRVAPERRAEVRRPVAHALRFMADVPVQSISAQTGKSVHKLFTRIQQTARAGARRVGTAELNRWLEDCIARHDPGMSRRGGGRRPLKLLYATQVGIRPPSFVIFCSDPAAMGSTYRRFLENRLRESFDFEGTPIRLYARARHANRK